MHSARSGPGARRQSVFSTPAVQALLIQAVSFPLVLLFAALLSVMAEVQLTIAYAALLQGVIAAWLTRVRAMAPWWMLIQFLFPLALLVVNALHLPSWIYLAAFLSLLCLYWTTFRTQVPYFPSTHAVWCAVHELLPEGRPIRFIDIGSGFGGLVMHLARRRPESRFVGIEAAPLPWIASFLRARLAGNAAEFVRGDYSALDFGSFDVVFAYLSPAAMPALWEKARAEMRHDALLLSYEFAVPGIEPHFVCQPAEHGPALYGWRF